MGSSPYRSLQPYFHSRSESPRSLTCSKAMKICPNLSSGIPIPESLTATSTLPPFTQAATLM